MGREKTTAGDRVPGMWDDDRPKHTPGPYLIGPAFEKRGQGRMIPITTDREYPGGICVALVKEGELTGEQNVNARMFAAGPAMVALLRTLTEVGTPIENAVSVSPWLRARMDEARAILADIDGGK